MSELGAEYTEAEARLIRIFDRLRQRIGAIIMTSAEDAVNKASDQLEKAEGEVTQQVAELNSVIADLQGQGVSDETLQRLQGVSQRLDDLNPDAPASAPESTPEESQG